MKMKAAKERKLLHLAAVLIVMVLLAAPAAEATRYLPGALAATQTLPPPSIADIYPVDAEQLWLFAESDVRLFSILALLDAPEVDQLNAQNRLRIFPDLDAIPRPLEQFAISKLASGLSTCTRKGAGHPFDDLG